MGFFQQKKILKEICKTETILPPLCSVHSCKLNRFSVCLLLVFSPLSLFQEAGPAYGPQQQAPLFSASGCIWLLRCGQEPGWREEEVIGFIACLSVLSHCRPGKLAVPSTESCSCGQEGFVQLSNSLPPGSRPTMVVTPSCH